MRWFRGAVNRGESDDRLRAVTQQAHQLGMKVMLKPQIWFPGGFIGDLEFPNEAERSGWFEQYRALVENDYPHLVA